MTAKTRAMPGLHRDYSRLKYYDTDRMLHQATQPPFIAGPLGVIILKIKALTLTSTEKYYI
jgi:hypothetical protein